jgi:hypothetical protein
MNAYQATERPLAGPARWPRSQQALCCFRETVSCWEGGDFSGEGIEPLELRLEPEPTRAASACADAKPVDHRNQPNSHLAAAA